MQSKNVCTAEPITKGRFQQILATSWSRVVASLGNQPAMAGRMGLNDVSVIKRVVAQDNLPGAHTIFNSLCADPTALDEILAEYGFRLSPLRADAANDFATLSGLCETAGEMADALKDGVRHHSETLEIAEKLRPVMPALTAILREADGLRAVRA